MNKDSNKNSGERRGVLELLAQKTQLPVDALSGEFRIELWGRNLLFMQGCRRILKYSPEEMVLQAKGFEVSVKGRRLVCTTYHDGAITLDGVIDGVELMGGEGDK